MNYARIAVASLGSFVAYFVFGGLVFALVPSLKLEFERHSNIYRGHDGIMKMMPLGMGFTLIAITALAVLYALIYRSGFGLYEGARFGVIVGVFVISAFVMHNYVNLNIGARLAVVQSIAYFIQWALVGVVIGAIYRAN